jgi:hypothetical protein
MKWIAGVVVIAGIVAGMPFTALACCGYGCCDCSCIASVPLPNAQNIMNGIRDLLRKQGIEAQAIDLVVRTDGKTVVLHQSPDKSVEQPKSGNH